MPNIINNMTNTKVLVPNKFWIIERGGKKIATLSKEKEGYTLLKRGQKFKGLDLSEIRERFGITIDGTELPNKPEASIVNEIYGFPVNCKPHSPLWNVKKKLPIYSKSAKSKSLYCAGYYVIRFKKGWVKSFCPKLITLDRYDYKGPFKTEIEMRSVLNSLSRDQNATT